MSALDYARVEKVIRIVGQKFIDQPSLDELARLAGLSPFHFHRIFSRWAGVTPKDFIRHLTVEHAKELLMRSRDVLSASIESGLSGPGRLHDLLVTVEAMTPGEFKSKGRGIEIGYGVEKTPFGECLIGMTPRGICHLSFEDSRDALEALRARWSEARVIKDRAGAHEVVDRIFGGSRKKKLPLLLAGSPFQIQVWRALLRIPSGAVASYGSVARAIGVERASRAVGTAVGRNEIAYLIPCHRVIRETGVIGDYRWGTERKKAMLAWEGSRSR